MLSKLNNDTITIINQIPQSDTSAVKVEWRKHIIRNCSVRMGIFDKSSGTMSNSANTFTVYVKDWQNYTAPDWLQNGYYSMSDEDKEKHYTANINDLVIFDAVPDAVPTKVSEFTALTQKYKDIGGLVSSVSVYINHKPSGEPWKTNHIEIVKG